ncbi:hypothetical protein [Paracoccus sp. (in: a-proteobacteria)]|uniref:hypothetical protein n=1 Tax=Paracoccus sp. TaxID=267 RepID=UPI00272C6531|nr:hypothetical protein [Paracoccus sp. (in: a-proteobacteria)]
MANYSAAGYMIQDIQGTAIYGVGATVDEAWQQVAALAGPFFDAYGELISDDQAYDTQFRAYGATADLIKEVQSCGGAIKWDVTQGIAHLPENDD